MKIDSQLERLKNENQLLLSKIFHEIRNPVALIRSAMDLMAIHHPEVTEYEEWDDILDSMDYLKSLLNEVSQFNNATRLKPQPTQISEFLESIFRSVQPTLDYLQIHFTSDFDLPDTPLLIDPTKLRQAILNLLRNAYEAVPVHGTIQFVASVKDNSLLFQVKDNGCGISAEDLSSLFQPFVTHKKEGTGLGLPITKQIIESHGGTISVVSTPGQGTIFTIRLPMEYPSKSFSGDRTAKPEQNH